MVTSLNCIMFNILPVRKLIKVVTKKRGLAKRDRAPTSLNVSGKNVSERNHLQIYFFIFILLLLYIIHSARLYYNIYNKYGHFSTFVSSEEANKYSPIRGPAKTLPVCFFDFQKFGNISVNKSVTDISDTDYSSVQRGGYYTPEECRSPNKVALIVPYRNREENLATFLLNIHPFLMKQKLEYRIFIIEQKGTELFNRGKLINAGFKEMMKYGSWGCVVFHDVDLLPTDERILYSCPIWPRHMCAKIIEITEKSFYTFFGGVSAMTTAHFQKVNGFSNLYWGWGGEDTDIFWRIRAQDIPIERYNRNIAKFTSLNHSKQVENTLRYSLLNTAIDRYKHDGLSTLKYNVEFVTLHRLYTHILMDINPNNENITEIMIKQSERY